MQDCTHFNRVLTVVLGGYDVMLFVCHSWTEAERGNWKEEMTKESTTMLYRALHNLIERSLSPLFCPSLS